MSCSTYILMIRIYKGHCLDNPGCKSRFEYNFIFRIDKCVRGLDLNQLRTIPEYNDSFFDPMILALRVKRPRFSRISSRAFISYRHVDGDTTPARFYTLFMITIY